MWFGLTKFDGSLSDGAISLWSTSPTAGTAASERGGRRVGEEEILGLDVTMDNVKMV